MFFHAFFHTWCRRCIQSVSDNRHHFDDGCLCTAWGKEFNNIKSYRTTSDNNNLLACHVFRIVLNICDHIFDRIHAGIFLSKIVMQSFDRWKERYRTSWIYNKIRVVFFNLSDRCIYSCFDCQIRKFWCTVFQISREIRKSLLRRNLRDLYRQTACFFLFLQ